MSVTIEARCPDCQSRIDVEYFLLGAPTICPSCRKTVVPEVPVGAVYPNTGHELTLSDFRQVLESAAAGPAVSELLMSWFGYRLSRDGGQAVVRSIDGEPVDPLALHREVQSDPTKQRELYGVAMALWR